MRTAVGHGLIERIAYSYHLYWFIILYHFIPYCLYYLDPPVLFVSFGSFPSVVCIIKAYGKFPFQAPESNVETWSIGPWDCPCRFCRWMVLPLSGFGCYVCSLFVFFTPFSPFPEICAAARRFSLVALSLFYVQCLCGDVRCTPYVGGLGAGYWTVGVKLPALSLHNLCGGDESLVVCVCFALVRFCLVWFLFAVGTFAVVVLILSSRIMCLVLCFCLSIAALRCWFSLDPSACWVFLRPRLFRQGCFTESCV